MFNPALAAQDVVDAGRYFVPFVVVPKPAEITKDIFCIIIKLRSATTWVVNANEQGLMFLHHSETQTLRAVVWTTDCTVCLPPQTVWRREGWKLNRSNQLGSADQIRTNILLLHYFRSIFLSTV